MAQCPKCDGFSQRFNISTIREYRDLVRQLIEIMNQGTFLLAHASCPLQDMFKTPTPATASFTSFNASPADEHSSSTLIPITGTQAGRLETCPNRLKIYQNQTETLPRSLVH